MNFFKIQVVCGLLIALSSAVPAYANDRTAAKYAYKVVNIEEAGVLNVRQKPSIKSPVILQLPADAKWIVKRTSDIQGRWQKVVWGASEGWVSNNYVNKDSQTSKLLEKYRQCANKNPEKSMCCGFPRSSAEHGRSHKIKTFRVVKVARGQSLNVRALGSASAKKIATLPHNATGVVKYPNQQVGRGRSAWQKIRWNGRDGWVKASFLKYDPIVSEYRNIVQQVCSSY